MTGYIIQAVVGAVIGFIGNKIPFVQNNQSTITNAILGIVGSIGGTAAAGATGIIATGDGITPTSVGTSVVGSLVGLLAGKLIPANKTA